MRRSTLLVFTFVFLSALTLYAATAAPSLTWAHDGADGGDLIAAAVTNGVPHPPGYPTYVTLGQVIALIPSGDTAQRFNLWSALCMALAAALTAITILPFVSRATALPRFVRAGVASVASLFFVTAPMVWGQATIAEVHALNACLVALIVLLVAPIVFRRENVPLPRWLLAAWLWGLAFGNSLTVAALAPLMILAWWRKRVRQSHAPHKKASSILLPTVAPVAAFLLGLSIYILIPVRAAQQPPINWGDATSLDRFSALVTAEMYRGYALTTSPADLVTRLIAFAQLIVAQYGWLGVILGAIGIFYALSNANKNWFWLALTLTLYLVFALTYATPDSSLYLIPLWMFGAWAIARGLLAMSQTVSRSSAAAAVAAVVVVLLLGPVLQLALNFSALDLHADDQVRNFADAILSAAPPQSIVVTETDGQTFALWYHRHVSGRRPDIALVDRRMADYPWYAAMLRAQGAPPILPEDDPPATWLDRLRQSNPERIICSIDPISARMSCQR